MTMMEAKEWFNLRQLYKSRKRSPSLSLAICRKDMRAWCGRAGVVGVVGAALLLLGLTQIVSGIYFMLVMPIFQLGSNIWTGTWSSMCGTVVATIGWTGQSVQRGHLVLVATLSVLVTNVANLVIIQVGENGVFLSKSDVRAIVGNNQETSMLVAFWLTTVVTSLGIVFSFFGAQYLFCVVVRGPRVKGRMPVTRSLSEQDLHHRQVHTPPRCRTAALAAPGVARPSVSRPSAAHSRPRSGGGCGGGGGGGGAHGMTGGGVTSSTTRLLTSVDAGAGEAGADAVGSVGVNGVAGAGISSLSGAGFNGAGINGVGGTGGAGVGGTGGAGVSGISNKHKRRHSTGKQSSVSEPGGEAGVHKHKRRHSTGKQTGETARQEVRRGGGVPYFLRNHRSTWQYILPEVVHEVRHADLCPGRDPDVTSRTSTLSRASKSSFHPFGPNGVSGDVSRLDIAMATLEMLSPANLHRGGSRAPSSCNTSLYSIPESLTRQRLLTPRPKLTRPTVPPPAPPKPSRHLRSTSMGGWESCEVVQYSPQPGGGFVVDLD